MAPARVGEKTCLAAVLLVFFLILAAQTVEATDLRGRINGQSMYSSGVFPVTEARVDLFALVNGMWRVVYTAFTGPDGMYYMRNIQPGKYYIQVNGSRNYPLTVYPGEYQDIAPILIRY